MGLPQCDTNLKHSKSFAGTADLALNGQRTEIEPKLPLLINLGDIDDTAIGEEIYNIEFLPEDISEEEKLFHELLDKQHIKEVNVNNYLEG